MKTLILLAALAFAVPAFACPMHDNPNAVEPQAGHEDHDHATTMEMSVPPSTKQFKDAMHMMHEDMSIKYSGNTDVDFVRGMIPHHQGAIDMAEIELKYGKDPETRKLATDIIKAQKAEIKTMQDWLKAREAKKPQ